MTDAEQNKFVVDLTQFQLLYREQWKHFIEQIQSEARNKALAEATFNASELCKKAIKEARADESRKRDYEIQRNIKMLNITVDELYLLNKFLPSILKKKPVEEKIKTIEPWICFNCNKSNPEESIYCKYCYKNRPRSFNYTPFETQMSSEPDAKVLGNACVRCGLLLNDESRYCESCASKIKTRVESKEEKDVN